MTCTTSGSTAELERYPQSNLFHGYAELGIQMICLCGIGTIVETPRTLPGTAPQSSAPCNEAQRSDERHFHGLRVQILAITMSVCLYVRHAARTVREAHPSYMIRANHVVYTARVVLPIWFYEPTSRKVLS